MLPRCPPPATVRHERSSQRNGHGVTKRAIIDVNYIVSRQNYDIFALIIAQLLTSHPLFFSFFLLFPPFFLSFFLSFVLSFNFSCLWKEGVCPMPGDPPRKQLQPLPRNPLRRVGTGMGGSAKPKKGGGSGNFLGRASRSSRFSHSTQLYIMKRGGPYYAPWPPPRSDIPDGPQNAAENDPSNYGHFSSIT